jgi:hypothetical protein
VQRYQLLFQRSIPDFEPSAEAYAVAVGVMEQMRSLLATAGLTRAEDFDLWTALVAGLAAQQTSNDPRGDRWLRLTDTAVDMFITFRILHVFAFRAGKSRGRTCGWTALPWLSNRPRPAESAIQEGLSP